MCSPRTATLLPQVLRLGHGQGVLVPYTLQLGPQSRCALLLGHRTFLGASRRLLVRQGGCVQPEPGGE
ncbi:hypothetical protein ACIBCU_37930 [Streptomyces sp. NPDC051064]|uniref:hypothetical protein n=1 Tax=Streptomyces sp. NPDC051064 TaxID=3365641 RepID=UPI0037A48BB6